MSVKNARPTARKLIIHYDTSMELIDVLERVSWVVEAGRISEAQCPVSTAD